MTANKFVYYRRFNELTRAQAEDVNRRYPANTDPWLYLYELQAGIVFDRYLMTEAERCRQ